MFKNLCPEALGISGRQSELIELALTYRFKGLDLDMATVAKRAIAQGFEHAGRYITSAKLKVGGFPLPVRWLGAEEDYKIDLNQLGQIAETASAMKALQCYVEIMPANDERPMHENFELHRARLEEVANVLAPHNVKIGIGFSAIVSHREGREFEFIHQPDTLLTLIKSIGCKNVGLLLDFWNWRLGGGTTDGIRELDADQIVIVRLADLPAEYDPQTINEDQRLMPGATDAEPTTTLLSMLIEKEYKGPICPCPHPSQSTGKTREAIVQQCSKVLDELIKTSLSLKAENTDGNQTTAADK